ncbi:hypothetical protein [Streptomyces sp. NPDC014733]|uniref:hypothetical protein n=1 Tax=Streptomyces sp. NPDC014733 TaxID=3364885 RepID=UPI0036FAB3DD
MLETLVQVYERVLPWAPLAPLMPLAVVMWWPPKGWRRAGGGVGAVDPAAFLIRPIQPPRSRRLAPGEGLTPELVAYERKLAADPRLHGAGRRVLVYAPLGRGFGVGVARARRVTA